MEEAKEENTDLICELCFHHVFDRHESAKRVAKINTKTGVISKDKPEHSHYYLCGRCHIQVSTEVAETLDGIYSGVMIENKKEE